MTIHSAGYWSRTNNMVNTLYMKSNWHTHTMLVGEKLKVVHAKAGKVHTMEYVGNHIYEDGVLKQTLIEGGYLTYSGNTPAYHFYVKDHLSSSPFHNMKNNR